VIEWNSGTTEGGSSGSPLFNQNRLIVGNLTGGQADCLTPVNDYFSKIHIAWDHYPVSSKQLRYWLDPDSTGLTEIEGFSPFGGNVVPQKFAQRYTLYPNPSASYVVFETDSQDISGGLLSVYTLSGSKITAYLITGETRLSFDVSGLQAGIYIVEFSKGNIRERRKLVVLNPPL
jgi:hypothetical protein